MYSLSKLFLVIGGVLILLGALMYLAGKYGLSLGRLPGDVRIETGAGVLSIPLATSLVLSIALTLAINIALRILRK